MDLRVVLGSPLVECGEWSSRNLAPLRGPLFFESTTSGVVDERNAAVSAEKSAVRKRNKILIAPNMVLLSIIFAAADRKVAFATKHTWRF